MSLHNTYTYCTLYSQHFTVQLRKFESSCAASAGGIKNPVPGLGGGALWEGCTCRKKKVCALAHHVHLNGQFIMHQPRAGAMTNTLTSMHRHQTYLLWREQQWVLLVNPSFMARRIASWASVPRSPAYQKYHDNTCVCVIEWVHYNANACVIKNMQDE